MIRPALINVAKRLATTFRSFGRWDRDQITDLSGTTVRGMHRVVDEDENWSDGLDTELTDSRESTQTRGTDDGSDRAEADSDASGGWDFDNFDQNSVLTAEEKDALLDYTNEDYKYINPALRSGEVSDEMRAKIAVLETALAKLFDHDGIVYRGISLPPEIVKSYRPGYVVTEAAFTSTASDRDGTMPGNVEFRILSQTGKKIPDWNSEHREEQEVLFLPGSRFEVLRPPRVTPDGETTIIEMVQRDGRASEGIVHEEFRTPEALGLEPLSDTAYLEHLFDSAVEYYGM